MTLPNRVGANFLDTAQWGAGAERALALIHQLDMAQITVVHGSHPDQAIAFCKRVKAMRGDRTDIFFRDISKLQDERNPDSMTPQEWFDLMRPRWLELGVIPVTWNEAIKTDMTPIVNWTLECIELAAKVGMPVATWKTASGTPRGYKDETPDGFSAANPLWKRAIELNKPRMDKGEKPLVYIAPHMGFDMTGGGGGHVDRPLEIIDRVKRLGLNPRYLPISFGEITSIGGGWRKLKLDPIVYANAFDTAFRQWFDQYGGTSMFYCIGDSVGGQWHDENLSDDDAKPFWDRLELLARDGRYRVKPFTAIPAPEPPAPILTPDYDPSPVQKFALYHVNLPGGMCTVFRKPNKSAERAGLLWQGQVVKYIDRQAVGVDWWYRVEWDTPIIGGVAVANGWLCLENNKVKLIAITQEVPTAPPTLPPPYIELSREFMLEMQAHHVNIARANLEAAVANEAIAELWGRLLAPTELPKAA